MDLDKTKMMQITYTYSRRNTGVVVQKRLSFKQDSDRVTMAKSCLVASLVTCLNLMIILARFWSGHYGLIFLPVRLPMNLTRF